MLEAIKQTADYLKNRIGDVPNTAIILKKSFINLCPIVIICTKIGKKELYCN
jgi:hypothetical protein